MKCSSQIGQTPWDLGLVVGIGVGVVAMVVDAATGAADIALTVGLLLLFPTFQVCWPGGHVQLWGIYI